MDGLAPAVRTRVESLEKLQECVDEVHKEFEEKLAKLRAEYDGKKAPFYKQRAEIVNKPSEGVPGFWRQVLKNNLQTGDEVYECDEEPLEYLTDIKATTQLG